MIGPLRGVSPSSHDLCHRLRRAVVSRRSAALQDLHGCCLLERREFVAATLDLSSTRHRIPDRDPLLRFGFAKQIKGSGVKPMPFISNG